MTDKLSESGERCRMFCSWGGFQCVYSTGHEGPHRDQYDPLGPGKPSSPISEGGEMKPCLSCLDGYHDGCIQLILTGKCGCWCAETPRSDLPTRSPEWAMEAAEEITDPDGFIQDDDEAIAAIILKHASPLTPFS